jgi:hypothetical protein
VKKSKASWEGIRFLWSFHVSSTTRKEENLSLGGGGIISKMKTDGNGIKERTLNSIFAGSSHSSLNIYNLFLSLDKKRGRKHEGQYLIVEIAIGYIKHSKLVTFYTNDLH